MIFWIFVAAVIVGLVMMLINKKCTRYFGDGYEIMAELVLIIGGLGVVGSLMIIGINHIDVNNQREMLRIQYESLKYQVENKLYENDDYSKKALIDQVTELNANIAYGERLENDFWIGIYMPNPYSDLELIEFK